jgi:type II secretory pathway pseudopilin PulG
MQRREREPGITWLRVIVTLIILAVLAGLLFPTINNSPPDRRSEAAVVVRNTVFALKSYHNDYGHFPEIGKPGTGGKFAVYVGDPACKMSESSNSALFDVLRAIPRGPNANHALNPRQQKYFKAQKARDPEKPRSGFADGPEFSAKDQGCLFDPWGRQYCIVFTTDGSDSLDLSAVYSDLAGPEHLLRVPAAAFSLGKDGVPGGKGYEGKSRKPSFSEATDDIVSWQ